MVGDCAPKSLAADLTPGALEPQNGSLWMLSLWFFDGRVNFHPIPNPGDLSERHPGLGHAEGARIHSEEEDFLAAIPVASDVLVVGAPGVIERVVDVADRTSKVQFADVPAEGSRDANHFFGVAHWQLSSE